MHGRLTRAGKHRLQYRLLHWLFLGLLGACSGEAVMHSDGGPGSPLDVVDTEGEGVDPEVTDADVGLFDANQDPLSADADSGADVGLVDLDVQGLGDSSAWDVSGDSWETVSHLDASTDAPGPPAPDVTPDVVADAEDDAATLSDAPSDPSDVLVDAGAPDAPGAEDAPPPSQPDVDAEPPDVGPPPVYEGTCCAPNGSKGCSKPACVDVVCEDDPYCCEMKWDSLCAKCAAGQSSDGACDGFELICDCDIAAAGACCDAHPGGLCDSLDCTLAVCELDPYCCDTTWDSYCVGCAQGGQTYDEVSCAGVEADCECEPPPTVPTHFELAEAWAPVWYHDSDDSAYEADYITAYDFDGDTVSANNWENLYAPGSDLRAVIYWSIIETTTHWYILYADFHPRDWTEDCDPFLPFTEPCHENDMEGAMVMVAKDGSDWGSFVLLVTEAHNVLHVFRNDPNITALSTEHLESPLVTFEGERHPELYVESKGHGVCALMYDGPKHCEHPVEPGGNPFPGGDGIVYRYKGVAEEPTSGNDWDVGYALVSLYDTLWQQRGDICDGACTFDQTFDYEGVPLAKAFDGDSWGDDKANPPWAWDDPDDGPVYRGDFFFRPAEAVTTWVDIPGTVSLTYTFNPFLDEL